MQRRDVLKLIAGSFTVPSIVSAIENNKVIESGWVPDSVLTRRFKSQNACPLFQQAGKYLAGSGAGKRVFLWKYLEKVTGSKFVPHEQEADDCVSHAWGLGVDILDAVQIAHGRGQWHAKAATEPIYAGGRVEIGDNKMRNSPGMHGTWAADWCRKYGILLRKEYLDKYDLTRYSGEKAKKWGHRCSRCTSWGGGVPDELEPIAKQHPVLTTTLATKWEQARDAVANGYPVAVCSSMGFKSERDRDGFLTPQGKWYHALLLAGIDDKSRRKGGLLINSWGKGWVSGPTQFDQPDGSFWVDKDDLEEMLKQEDSFVLSAYNGYPKQDLDYRLY